MDIKNLKRFINWKLELEKDDLTLWNYAESTNNIEVGISFTKIFYPDLIEHDSLVFIKQNFNEKNYKDWRTNLGFGKEPDIQIQLLFNHVHIYDLFLNDLEEIELDVYEYFGQMLLKFWKFSINDQYPNKKFIFFYETEPNSYGPTISFYENL